MNTILTGKVILVTGGTGSIGSEIVRQSLAQGAKKVLVLSRDEIKHFLMRKRIEDDRLDTVVGDIRNSRSIDIAFQKYDIDIIYHAAAMKHVVMCDDFPMEAVQTNIIGTQNVVDMAIKYHIGKTILISTDKAVYPVNILGTTKFTAEKIAVNASKIRKHNQVFACVRFGNVSSSRGSVIPVYIDNLLHGNPLEVTNPDVTRFVMEISDAVNLVIKATDFALGGEIFILKMKAFKLGDLVDVITQRIALRLNVKKENIKFNYSGLNRGEKLHEDLVSATEASRMHEVADGYVILPDNISSDKYTLGKKISFSKYSSNDVELISKDEIERMVLKYLDNRSSGSAY
jgi:UDP-N-acetylglucosamine 4,6-dehydratase/5-epimerase